MGRDHTFSDKEFNTWNYDPEDRGEFEKNLVYVIMSFTGDDMRIVYSVIKDECQKIGLNAIRADEIIGSSFIYREITNLIERAEFIICDLSYERPNVYYEFGYAHGVGNENMDILLIAKEATKIHFDIVPLRINFYENSDHLREIINVNLKKMIEITRKLP
jgi:hypothetical protein